MLHNYHYGADRGRGPEGLRDQAGCPPRLPSRAAKERQRLSVARARSGGGLLSAKAGRPDTPRLRSAQAKRSALRRLGGAGQRDQSPLTGPECVPRSQSLRGPRSVRRLPRFKTICFKQFVLTTQQKSPRLASGALNIHLKTSATCKKPSVLAGLQHFE